MQYCKFLSGLIGLLSPILPKIKNKVISTTHKIEKLIALQTQRENRKSCKYFALIMHLIGASILVVILEEILYCY